MKKVAAIFLAIMMILALCACGNKTSQNESNTSSQDKNNIIDDIEQGTDNSAVSTKLVNLNELFTVNNMFEIELNNAKWSEKILPSNTTGAYSYHDDNEGEKYFVIRGKFKNLSSKDVDIQYSGEVKMIINGKYEVNATMELEKNDGTSFYGNAKPLQTLNLIIFSSVSDELYSACNDIQVNIDIVNDEEKLNYYYQSDYPHDSFVITFDNSNQNKI